MSGGGGYDRRAAIFSAPTCSHVPPPNRPFLPVAGPENWRSLRPLPQVSQSYLGVALEAVGAPQRAGHEGGGTTAVAWAKVRD